MDAEKSANRAFERGDYFEALKISEKLAAAGDLGAIYTCAIIYELGSPRIQKDLTKAWSYFEKLARQNNLSEGYLGMVRIIIERKDIGKSKMAESYCRLAIEADGSAFGFLLLGDVKRLLVQPPKLDEASGAYFSAAIRGALWGWRRWANVKRVQGDWLAWVVIHAIATLITPFYLIILGRRASRSG
jgi:TPR repeat protein